MKYRISAARIALFTSIITLMFIQTAYAATGSINATDVRFRSVPNTASTSTILSLLGKNTSVEILGRESDWVQVRIGDKTGYVFGRYVTVVPDPIPAAPVAAAVAAPVPETPAIAPVSETPAVASVQETPEAATPQTDSTTPPAGAKTEDWRFVEANALNIRTAGTAESTLLGKLTFGQEVVWLEAAGEWAKIKTVGDITGFVLGKYLAPLDATASRGSIELVDELIAYAMSLRGIHYVYGGMSLSGFDCSGFVKYVYQGIGVETPRSSYEYGSVGVRIARADLLPGDVILWDTDGSRVKNISHVGIYLGNDKFIHASTSKNRVLVASVSGYQATYLGARRFLK